jgi:hypothetical protein
MVSGLRSMPVVLSSVRIVAIPPAYLNVLPRSVELPAHHKRHISSWPFPCIQFVRGSALSKLKNPCHIIEGKGLTAVS